MPQIILSTTNKYFKTIVKDISKKELQIITWNTIYDIINNKYSIPKSFIHFVNKDGRRKKISSLVNEKLNIQDFRMFNVNTSQYINDYLITYTIV